MNDGSSTTSALCSSAMYEIFDLISLFQLLLADTYEACGASQFVNYEHVFIKE